MLSSGCCEASVLGLLQACQACQGMLRRLPPAGVAAGDALAGVALPWDVSEAWGEGQALENAGRLACPSNGDRTLPSAERRSV